MIKPIAEASEIPDDAGVALVQTVPLDVSTFPLVLGAILVTADVPAPTNTLLVV